MEENLGTGDGSTLVNPIRDRCLIGGSVLRESREGLPVRIVLGDVEERVAFGSMGGRLVDNDRFGKVLGEVEGRPPEGSVLVKMSKFRPVGRVLLIGNV